MSNVSSSIFELVNMFRVYGNYEQSFGAIYYILYCLHKGYRVYFNYDTNSKVSDISIISENGRHLKDVVISDYPVSNIIPAFVGWSGKNVEKFLSKLSDLISEREYQIVIENISQLFVDNIGRIAWETILPINVVKLVCKIAATLSIGTVYNPFPKDGTLALHLESSSYNGEEWNLANAAITRIRLDAYGFPPEVIKLGNPMTHSFPEDCDSVISIPPFMLKQMGAEMEFAGKAHKTHTVEDYLLWRFLENKNCRTGIFVLPAGIGFTPRYLEIREALTKACCIDSIISLPSGIFYGTAINTLILILNKDKKDGIVKFIDGSTNFIKDKKKNILDYTTILNQYLNPTTSLVYWSSEQEIIDKDYSFSPAMYATYKEVIPEGYKEFGFDEVFRIPQMTLCKPFDRGYVLKPTDFSQDYLQIMENRKEKGSPDNQSYRKSIEPVNLAISFLNDTMKIVKLEADCPVYANSNQIPLILRDDSPIALDYAIFSLLHNNQFRNLAKCYSGMQLRRARDLAKYLQTIKLLAPAYKVIQEQEVSLTLKSLKNKKAQLLKDELARLESRETVSDLSHMLNTPFSNIGDLLGALEDEETSQTVKVWIMQLRDNFDYLKRLIQTVGADFSLNSSVLEEIKVIPFLEKFEKSWTNITHQSFKIEIESQLESTETMMLADTTLLKIALDAVFKNAERHGFGEKFNKNNRVSLILSAVNHQNKPYVCIAITNNGLPFPQSFTIEDYAKRGRHGGPSGKTGLGGYHVYSIVKKMGGYLNLSSNADGETIIELLIPAPKLSVESLNVYNNAESCI